MQSKHLFGVFKEARGAYRERKAEMRAERDARLVAERSRRRYNDDYYSDDDDAYSRPHLARRHTEYSRDNNMTQLSTIGGRSRSDQPNNNIDMELAYGSDDDFHPPRTSKEADKRQLKGLVSKTQQILEETNCLKYSVQRTIEHLQKNPNAMAAVALTLAEISNLLSKMGPSAAVALRTASPGVFGLLASPQFLLAAGLGVGITVVMFGGYKVVKRIKADQEREQRFPNGGGGSEFAGRRGEDEMLEFNSQYLGGIERWRRGVADVRAESCGTSVDGELITPFAAQRLADDEYALPPSTRGSRSSASIRRAPTAPSRHSRAYYYENERYEPSRTRSVRSGRSPSRPPPSRASGPPPKEKKRTSALRYLLG